MIPHIVLEIVRQKWRLLSVIALLLLGNAGLALYASGYQSPALAQLQTRWSDLRRQAARSGFVDAATLYTKGAADLETVKKRVPEKREFARVLGELYETAASDAVEIGTVSYKASSNKEESLLSYQLNLSVSGRYASVKSYLADVQKLRDLMVVDSVGFTNSDLYEEHVSMNLRITVYLREGA